MADATATIAPTTTTAPATDTSGTTTLPNGTTIAPNQVNVGTETTPDVITTSTPSRTATNQASGSLSQALAMFNLGNGQTTNTPQTTPATGTATADTDPTAGVTTVNPDGSTNTGTSVDPYIQSLNNIAASSNASTKLLVQSVLNAKNMQQNQVDQQYAAYKNGLQLLGIEHNEAQSAPGLLASQVNQAEDQHQQKLQTIQANTAKALATAQTAQENNDFKTLQDQMAYVKQLNDEKTAELKAYQTSLTNQPKVEAAVASQVYDTLQTLDPDDQEAFLQAVSQQYNIPLGGLVAALTQVPQTQATAAAKATEATATAANDVAKEGTTGLLTVAEAKSLGLPYGTTIADATKMGIVPTTKSTKASTAAISKEQIAAGESALDATKGSDGYVDPYAYHALYNSYTKAGGTTASFLKAYPPADYVNPKATNLPTYLMPKVSKSSRSS